MNNQKGLTPVHIVILITLLVVGYLIYQKQSTPQTAPSSSQQTAQPTSSPASNAELPKPTASKPSVKEGWKQYSSAKIGFSYQLPENDRWSIKTTDAYCQLKLERNEGDQYLCVRVFDNPKGLSRREFYCSDILRQEDVQNCLESYIEVSDTKVGNKDALYITEPGTQVDHARVVSTNGKIMVVSDHTVSFPKTPTPPGFLWSKLRDIILDTFWFN